MSATNDTPMDRALVTARLRDAAGYATVMKGRVYARCEKCAREDAANIGVEVIEEAAMERPRRKSRSRSTSPSQRSQSMSDASEHTRTEPQKTVVLAGPSKWRKLVISPNDVRLGWRITCQDGSPYDVFWGSTPKDRLDGLLAGVRALHGEVEVVDLRDRPDDVRDRDWFDATQRAALLPTDTETTTDD